MKNVYRAWLVWLAVLLPVTGAAVAAAEHGGGFVFRLPPAAESYFVQDNLVNRRLLRFSPQGSYSQIEADRTGAAEVDRGTWEQDAGGLVLLHPTCAALRCRALTSGPLTVVLDRPGALPALPGLAAAMRRFLAQSTDGVFAAAGTREISKPAPEGAVLSIDPRAETFARAELMALAQQIEDVVWSERTNTYILVPVRDGPHELLVLPGAVFGAADVARVRRDYHVPDRAAPPFYFARTDLPAFARAAGRWKVLQLPGGRR